MHDPKEKLALQLLATLYELGRGDIAATPEILVDWLSVPAPRVQELLEALSAQGLVEAERCRLTMQGLVLAVSMHGAQKLSRQGVAA
jgi:Mn-dependent DtxR family transcriptional regulator